MSSDPNGARVRHISVIACQELNCAAVQIEDVLYNALNYMGHNCRGHNFIGHPCSGHNYMGHDYIGHNYAGHNCYLHPRAEVNERQKNLIVRQYTSTMCCTRHCSRSTRRAPLLPRYTTVTMKAVTIQAIPRP